jgi:hypothetical protein
VADWTQDTTVSQPTKITIKYSPRSAPKTLRSQALISTQRTTTTTVYKTFEYKDAEGQPQQEDVAISQEAVTRNTVAAVCQAYVTARLSEAMGLPAGDANKRETTTYEYTVTTEGVRLLKERSEIWISQYELVGGLNVPFETIIATPGSLPWHPSGKQVLSTITETVYEESVIPAPYAGAPGKPYTRTKVSRWICRGQTQEGKQGFDSQMKDVDSTNAASWLPGMVADMEEVVFDGTEIRTSIGRTPVLSRPTGQEQDYADIEERKDDQTADSTFYDDKSWPDVDLDYGGPDLPDWTDWDKTNPDTNEPDWKDLAPKWQDYDSKDPIPDDNELTDTDQPPDPDNPDQPPDPDNPDQPNPDPNNPDTTTDEPDWAPLVPKWDAYDGVDSNSDGTPDWADFVPSDKDWRDLQADSNGDGIPDWADYVPDWTAYDGVDSDGDGVPDWAAFVPGWEAYQGDSNGDGVPDWAEFVPDGSTRSRTYITATYEMSLAPDDFWLYNTAEGQTLVRSGASEAARKFGEIENSLRTGHALGINITSEAKALPTAPLAPIYVNAEGLVAGFLMNGVSWAFDGNGLVVSADLLLMGVAGLDTSVEEAQAWVRLPAGTGGLQTLDLDPDIGSLTPANTIDMPEDLPAADRYRVFRWLPRDGADVLGPYLDPDRSLVAPFLPRSRMIGRSRHRAQMEEYPFRLSTTEELVGVVRAVGTLQPQTAISVPAKGITVAAHAPDPSGGGATLAVPSAVVTIAGLAPQWAGIQKTIVLPPSAALAVAAAAPGVSSGGSVAVPAAGIGVAGGAPVVDNGITYIWQTPNNGNPPANSYRLYASGFARLSTTTASGYSKNELLAQLTPGRPVAITVNGISSTGAVSAGGSVLDDAGTATERIILVFNVSPSLTDSTLSDTPLSLKIL